MVAAGQAFARAVAVYRLRYHGTYKGPPDVGAVGFEDDDAATPQMTL
jgi:hypothetical protein